MPLTKRGGGWVALAAPASSREPRVRVAALIQLGDEVVLVRHRMGDRTYHLLPGGGVAWGETLEAALTREVEEETGLAISVGDVLFVNDTIDPSGDRHVINITFGATATGGAITTDPSDPRVEAVDLYPASSLDDLDLRPPMAGAIALALSGDTSTGRVYRGSLYRA